MVDPGNPYAPGAPAPVEPARPKPDSTGLAGLVSLLGGGVFSGFGLLLLGRPRRCAAWGLTGLAAGAGGIAAALAARPGLCLALLGGSVAVGLGAFIDTWRAKALGPRLLHPALAVAIVVFVGWGGALAVRVKLLEAFRSPSGSMMPTILAGDHFVVDKRRATVERGDVVVFRSPHDPAIDYIKRVLAVGGDRIEFRAGAAVVNGRELPLASPAPCPGTEEGDGYGCRQYQETLDQRRYAIIRRESGGASMSAVEVPPGHLFVVGDNRDNSNDSRLFGPVPLANVKGRALFVWWSESPGGDLRLDRAGQVLR